MNLSGDAWRQCRSYYVASHLHQPKSYWYIFLFVLLTFFIEVRYLGATSIGNISQIFGDSPYLRYFDADPSEAEATTTEAPDVVITVDEQDPPFKLTARSDDRPSLVFEKARMHLLNRIKLQETCQKDPSTTVVDVGAHLGTFGLYAAACGCTVYMYEVDPQLIKLIRASIKENQFPASRVHLFHKLVSNLRTNSSVPYPPGDGSPAITDDPITIKSIRMDDVQLPAGKIFLLRMDIDGNEANVLRSASQLFAHKRIQHVLFKYTPWTADREAQKKLLPYIKKDLQARSIYALFQSDEHIYGPLRPREMAAFYDQQLALNIPTEVYVLLDEKLGPNKIQAKRYHTYKQPA